MILFFVFLRAALLQLPGAVAHPKVLPLVAILDPVITMTVEL